MNTPCILINFSFSPVLIFLHQRYATYCKPHIAKVQVSQRQSFSQTLTVAFHKYCPQSYELPQYMWIFLFMETMAYSIGKTTTTRTLRNKCSITYRDRFSDSSYVSKNSEKSAIKLSNFVSTSSPSCCRIPCRPSPQNWESWEKLSRDVTSFSTVRCRRKKSTLFYL